MIGAGGTVGNMADDIVISAEPVKRLTVNLVGVSYSVRPPKGAMAIVLATKMQKAEKDPAVLLDGLGDWLKIAVGKDEAKAIRARLEDPEDALDFEHIMTLLQKLSEASTGNPTT